MVSGQHPEYMNFMQLLDTFNHPDYWLYWILKPLVILRLPGPEGRVTAGSRRTCLF